MWLEELRWTRADGWRGQQRCAAADLVIYFGHRDEMLAGGAYEQLRAACPAAHVVGASAAASIQGTDLDDSGAVAAAMGFAGTGIRVACRSIAGPEELMACGETLGAELAATDLAGVFVLSDGLLVNGSGLSAGLARPIAAGVPIFGGLAGDSCDFTTTIVSGDGAPRSGNVAAVGFYGDAIRIRVGSKHGWDAVGPRRRITRSAGNLLFELDDKPAFELYRRYMGDEIAGETGAQVIFPLLVWPPEHPDRAVVRAVIKVDPQTGRMMFGGEMPLGWTARLMRGNLDRLALAAADAARDASPASQEDGSGDCLALLISCAGRLFLMGQNTPEELEAAAAELRPGVLPLGFYSYGEIAPTGAAGVPEMHNQTMTIATLFEAAR